MITENLSTLKIHKLSQEQYNRELEAGRIDPNALYLTPNEETDLTSYATKEEVLSTYETKSDAADKLTEAKDYAKEYADTLVIDLQTQLNAKLNSSDVITNDEIDEICSFAISAYLNTISAEGVSF